jgi:small multidrug resistance pump
MGVALRQLNVGVVYAIWSAVGTAAVSILGVLLFGERLNWQAVVGMVLLVGGVLVLVGSGSVSHS